MTQETFDLLMSYLDIIHRELDKIAVLTGQPTFSECFPKRSIEGGGII